MQGCYRDNPGSRDLPVQITNLARTTPAACIEACREAGYRYAGLQVTDVILFLARSRDCYMYRVGHKKPSPILLGRPER